MIPFGLNPLGVGELYNDLDILKLIRGANPTSQLPTLWLDSEDPYTQWEGIQWGTFYGVKRVVEFNVFNLPNIFSLPKINKLQKLGAIYLGNTRISTLDLSGLTDILTADIYNIPTLTTINLSGTIVTARLDLQMCNLTELTGLNYKGNNFINYNFTKNRLNANELTRLRSIGFNDDSRLLPQNP